MIKLMTLNLWCYFDWDNRIGNIKNLIKQHSPDVIAFQEVQINTQYSTSASSCLLIEDEYPYHVYEPAWGLTEFMSYDEHMKTRQSHGLAFASKYPIISSEVIWLTLHPGREEPAIALLCKLDTNGTETYVCNVHFDNTNETSEAQLKELMIILEKRGIQPIMLGDFNHFNLKYFSSTILKDYSLSTEIIDYTSMPKDKGTLDYIVAPKKYMIDSVVCPETYVSDHRPVIASLKLA